MKKLILFTLTIFIPVSVYSADNVSSKYRSEIQNYKDRCQKGDYTNARLLELEDIDKINLIGRQIGKQPFISSCKNSNKAQDTATNSANSKDKLTSNTKNETSNVIHNGLEWIQSPNQMTWGTAQNYCSYKFKETNTGWRQPDIRELTDLYNSKKVQKSKWAVNKSWSSEQFGEFRYYRSDLSVNHKYLDLQNGEINGSRGDDVYAVCVRSAESYENVANGGGYVPKENETYKSPKSDSSIDATNNTAFGKSSLDLVPIDSHSYFDKNSLQRFGNILRVWTYIDLSHKPRDNVYSIKSLEDINCSNKTYQLLELHWYLSPNYSGEEVDTSMFERSRSFQMLKGSQTEKLYYMFCDANIASPAPNQIQQLPQTNNIGQNCELARAQAYLTPVPSGSFAESQQYADRAYASCMANQPVPLPPVAPPVVSPSVNTGITHFLKGQWVERGQQMCKYDDGTVINIGIGMCPLSR